MAFEIESGIAVPEGKTKPLGTELSRAMTKMQIGDSLVVPHGTFKAVHEGIRNAGKRAGIKTRCAKCDAGHRVWRIA